jgi:hypothetical protein
MEPPVTRSASSTPVRSIDVASAERAAAPVPGRERMPAVVPVGSERSGAVVRLKGLRRTVDLIVHRIGMEAVGRGSGFDPLLRSIRIERRALETELRQKGVAGEDLSAEARGVRGWLGWLAGHAAEPAAGGEADHAAPLAASIAATARVREDLARRLAADDALLRHLTGRRRIDRGLLHADPDRRLIVAFRPMRAVTRAEVREGAVRVWVQAPLAAASGDELMAVAAMVAGDGPARQRVHEAMLATPYQSALAGIEDLGGAVARTRGAVHDLESSFRRVNASFFGGRMERPTISWSRADTRRMFGHYEFVSDSLVVSSSLDRGDVPEFVVDFIVYHELLHKKHGLRWSGSRAHAHTPEFRRDERRFPGMAEAERVLRRIAAGR